MPDIITTGAAMSPVGAKLYGKDSIGDPGFIYPTQRVRHDSIRVGFFGDSTAVVGVTQASSNQDTSIINVPYPASGSTIVGLTGDRCAMPMMYPLAYPVFSGGVSGQDTTQMLARDTAAAGITRRAITDANNASLDLLVIRAMINDIIALTAAGSTQADIDAIWTRYLLIINRALAGTPFLMCETLGGYSATGVVDPDLSYRRNALLYLNDKIRTLPALFPGRIIVCDLAGYTLSTDGAFISGCSTDGVHDNSHGAYKRAEAEAHCLEILYGKSLGPRYRGVNLFPNSSFANVAVTGQGTVATGVALSGTSVTAGSAAIEIIDGVPWQTAIFTPSVYDGNANGYIRMVFDPNALGWAENSVYGIEFDFSIMLSDGSALPVTTIGGMVGNLYVYKTAAGQITVNSLYGNTTAGIVDPYKGRIVFPPFKTQEAGSALTSVCNITLQSYFSGAVPLKLGIASPRMVLQS